MSAEIFQFADFQRSPKIEREKPKKESPLVRFKLYEDVNGEIDPEITINHSSHSDLALHIRKLLGANEMETYAFEHPIGQDGDRSFDVYTLVQCKRDGSLFAIRSLAKAMEETEVFRYLSDPSTQNTKALNSAYGLLANLMKVRVYTLIKDNGELIQGPAIGAQYALLFDLDNFPNHETLLQDYVTAMATTTQ